MADISPQFVADVRRYLRVNHTHHDSEIIDLIEAARADLLLGNILAAKVEDENDALIRRAIKLYAKADFGLENTDSEKYSASYQSLRNHLMLSDEYTKTEEA